MKKSSYWWTPQNIAVYPHDVIPTEAEVVIIGAGIAGVSSAYWLCASKRKSIVVVDAGPYPAFKGSGREFGMATICGGKSYQRMVDRVGQEKAYLLYRMSKRNNLLLDEFIQKNEVPCQWEMNGGLRLAGCQAEMQTLVKSYEALNDIGIANALLDDHEAQAIVPSNKLYGALYIPSEGYLDPFAFIHFVSSRLRESTNVRFCYNARVDQIVKSQRNAFRYVLLDNGHTIKARVVIHANGETPNLPYLIPYREHAISTESLPDNVVESFPRMPLTMNDGEDYFRLGRNSLLAAGCRYADSTQMECGNKNDSSYNAKIYQSLSTAITRCFPITSLVGHSHAWTFISYDTPDGLPIIGTLPNDDSQYVLEGFGSHRFGMAFICGRIIAEQIRGQRDSLAQIFRSFQPSRFNNAQGDENSGIQIVR